MDNNIHVERGGQASIQILLIFLDNDDTVQSNAANELNGDVHMTDESDAAAIQLDPVPELKTKQTRQRSAVAFAYIDLEDVMEVAAAIHEHVGSGDCDEHQLSAWLSKSQKSSGFRILLSTARLFGLIESDGGQYRLSSLGRRAVDSAQARDAKAKAFLTVPLYSTVFENYKGGVLPPPAALEREIVLIGVAEKQKHTARLVLERSAQYAGFFEHGKDRLVMPGISPDAGRDAPKREDPEHTGGGGTGGGGGGKPRHPFIEGLLQTLPDPDTEKAWSVDKRIKWLQTAANIFDLIYEGEGGIKVEPAVAPRSPRPHD
jgi:hypothetical protein